MTASRGFYGFRPLASIQIPVSLMSSFLIVEIIPVNVLIGGEFALNMGRLSVAPNASAGLSYYHVTTIGINTDTDFLSHIGAQAGGRISYLFNQNTRAFVDLGIEYWLAMTNLFGNESYGGAMFGAGVTFKL